MAQVKHYAVYNQETNRNTVSDDAIVDDRTVHEIYTAAFGAMSIQGPAGRRGGDLQSLLYDDDLISTDAGGKRYRAHVGFISPVAEFTPKSVETKELRTDLVYRLRVIVDDPDPALKQGMPVTVTLRNLNR